MEYDIESILEMYEDDYNPSSKVPGPRNMYKYAGVVKQGPNTGKHKYTDFYPKDKKGGTAEWFDSKKEMNEALQKRKEASGRGLTNEELTKKFKTQLKAKGYETWNSAPDNVKRSISSSTTPSAIAKKEEEPRFKKEGLDKRLNEKTRKLLAEKKPINPKTGLPYTLKEYTDLTAGQKGKLLNRLKGKFKSKIPKPRQGYYPEKDANKLINFLKISADKQKKNNVPLKERTFINVFEKDKFVGVRDVKANTLYTHIDYTGNKKGTSIALHPSQDETLSFLKEAKKFKFEKPEKLLGSYFSKYERVPTYNEIYNFFNRDRNAPLKSFKQNALEIHHRNLIEKVPDKNFQLVTMKKNTEANRILNLFNNKQITKQQADTALKNLGVNLEGMGKQDITTGKSLGSAKRETIKLFKDAYKNNPKIVEDITQKLQILGCPKSLQKASGGRIKFSAGSTCAIKGKKVLEQGLKNGFKESDQALAKGILKSGKFLKDAVSLRGLFGPAALAFTAAAEAGIVGYDMLSTGKSFREAVGDSVFNYMLGDKTKIDSVKERNKRMIEEGMTPEQMGKIGAMESAFDDLGMYGSQFNKLAAIQKNRDAISMSPEDTFNKNAFQLDLDRQEDEARENIQDFNRRIIPPRGGERLEGIDYAGGFKNLAEGLARNEFAQLQSVDNPLQSRKGDEKRAARMNELMLQYPDLAPEYDFMEGGIASLNVKK